MLIRYGLSCHLHEKPGHLLARVVEETVFIVMLLYGSILANALGLCVNNFFSLLESRKVMCIKRSRGEVWYIWPVGEKVDSEAIRR
jgi:hypothetical protein